MVRPPYILADFPVDDPLSEYFSHCKNIEFDFLPVEARAPAVDIIADRISGKDKVSLILSPNLTLKKLYKEKSIYNDFNEISKKLNIILYDEVDLLLGLYNIADREPDFSSWLNELKPNVLNGGIAGKWFKENYNKCEFIELHDHLLSHGRNFPELSSRKRHDPEKDFLCLMSDHDHGRAHRKFLHEQMTAKGLIEHTIYNFSPKSTETFDDLKGSFPEIVTKGITWPDGIPPVHYYNQTNLEIVAETFGGHHDHDDTFYISEKTTKPIAMKHPFVVLSSFHFLKNLRALGFRTFSDHLDESYDLEQDMKKRVGIITDNLLMLKGSSRKLYDDTKEIRDHNLLNLQHQTGMYKTKLWNRMDEFMKNV
jgi:hypothetical protein